MNEAVVELHAAHGVARRNVDHAVVHRLAERGHDRGLLATALRRRRCEEGDWHASELACMLAQQLELVCQSGMAESQSTTQGRSREFSKGCKHGSWVVRSNHDRRVAQKELIVDYEHCKSYVRTVQHSS